ncbi:MAG: tyrosine-type recombinase/integrase [Ferrovum myxofaciens]|nr:tyrosine-type recombinase/integrase [Ferrovum myxofaciens]
MKKERFLTEEEAQKLYETVCRSENPMLKFIVPMLILTGARKTRGAGMQSGKTFDIVRKQWRIPVTKTGRPRHVPLSEGVLQLLDSIPHDECPWVFLPTQRPTSLLYRFLPGGILLANVPDWLKFVSTI